MTAETLDRGLVLDSVRVTEIAAIAAWSLVGRGDEKAADQAAVDAMRTGLNDLDIDGEIVIGEGERDEAPMLYIGEKVGRGGPAVDIALDPLKGTTLTAKAMSNALTVMAWARLEEHTSELSHVVISYAVLCLQKKKKKKTHEQSADCML